MKKKFLLALIVVAISIIIFGNAGVLAGSYEDLTYFVSNGEVTITGCDDSMIMEMKIPSTMEGYPVTNIGDSVFEDCRELASITIPVNITIIGDYAFRYCDSLDNVYYEGTEEEWKVISIGSGNEDLANATIHYNHNPVLEYLTYTITNGEVTITGCDDPRIMEMIIPSTIDGYPVTNIGDKAFQACGIKSITIPDSVTSIGYRAFSGCWNLTSITIPDGVTSIGNQAFIDCGILKSIIVDDNSNYCSIDGVLFNKNKTILMQYPAGKTNIEYIIPNGVTSVGEGAFFCSINLKSITIPDGVTNIGDKAFFDCWSLESITIPEGVTSIGDSAFCFCESLVSITIPEGVASIGDYAFSGCSSLTSITIPDGVTSIGDYAFSSCRSLKSFTIPDSVTSIEDYAFSGCSSLTSIIIPDGVISMGIYAFSGCRDLESITIPNGITNIGNGVFYSCSNIADVYYKGTEEEWKAISIEPYNKGLTNAAIHFAPNTKTTLANNRKSFTITPINVENYKTVILVLYDGDKFIETQSAVYTGEVISFTTTKEYINAKVMVWDDFASLKPVCKSENVK